MLWVGDKRDALMRQEEQDYHDKEEEQPRESDHHLSRADLSTTVTTTATIKTEGGGCFG